MNANVVLICRFVVVQLIVKMRMLVLGCVFPIVPVMDQLTVFVGQDFLWSARMVKGAFKQQINR
jgi:hypothetical protein